MHPELRKISGMALEYYLAACLDAVADGNGMSDLAYRIAGEVVVATRGRGIDLDDDGWLDNLEVLAVAHLGEHRIREILDDAQPGKLRWRSYAMAESRALELAAGVPSADPRLHCTVETERRHHDGRVDHTIEFWFSAEEPCMLARFGSVEFSKDHAGSRTEVESVFERAFAEAARVADELELAESVVAVTEPGR